MKSKHDGSSAQIQQQAHESAIRAATYSHSEDWLISADQDGVVKYWQINFNNVKAIQAHHDPIRDLSFSPNDNKFVTACDDASLKIFDFAEGIEESTLTGHNWDVKSVDWHPTKGLLVSGSKDHQVKLWDPRTGRCLTTLHGHKNTISKTAFEPTVGQLLATCARDQTARIFDLRMMRDICLLRGHEKDVSALTWHPIHKSLLSTGGSDGCIFHFLLDEPNTPSGSVTSIPPYDSVDPTNAPAQTIYPAHKIQYAHDFNVWSLDWHPLGHILASGSNDRVTRFWARARPGETDCFKDRYHLDEAAAEAQGTWDRRGGRRSMREDEEQEQDDEAEGLVDQKMPAKQPVLPGIPGLNMPGTGTSTGTGAAFPAHARSGPRKITGMTGLPPPPSSLPVIDPEHFKAMFAGGTFPPPLPPPTTSISLPANPHLPPPPPPPPPFPTDFDFSKMPPGMFPPGFQLPQGFPPAPGSAGAPGVGDGGAGAVGIGLPGLGGGMEGAGRRRAPLPSQKESLAEEQRRGKYRPVR